jgi:2-polyprenyl-3-methyl-5-hydroxy-6-metoxy-1,4-benzoquinol methylase
MGRERLERTMRRRWRSADVPPWGALHGDRVEHAKVKLLAPHIGSVHSVLDCGCGGGDFLGLIDPDRRFERVVGLDVAEQAIERARRTGRYGELVCGHFEDAPRRISERFDLVLLGEVLYYIRDYQTALTRMLDAFLAPRGTVFIAVAMGRGYFWRRDLRAVRRLLAERGLRAVCDERIDYTVRGLPRRWFFPWFAQDSKQVMIYRAEM